MQAGLLYLSAKEYQEIPNAFPDDVREHYLAEPDIVCANCGHEAGYHIHGGYTTLFYGECADRTCSCQSFQPISFEDADVS